MKQQVISGGNKGRKVIKLDAVFKEHFQKHKLAYEILALFCYFGINATINATSVLMEAAREFSASFQVWEPFVWEYSSALATLIAFPLIAWFMRTYPWNWQTTKSSFGRYIFSAISYGLLHVCLMVTMREFVYLLAASDYQFSNSFQQFFLNFYTSYAKTFGAFASL